MPPIATETVLQSRYRLLKLLVEGGFARTYLAEDQGRFGERCVVKEFCPPSNAATVLEKAKELFQREAQTLYQLDHPQVPQFRGMFTEEIDQTQRLFLVQDFVEGETYRSVLRQRLQGGEHFTVQEVRQLLKQLLPVLAYIHGKGIIHRDITLDNLMLRSSDHKPVLIDFGVVKTVVTQLQHTNVMPTGTAVGKFGFAPMEQLQSGRAYPSSDLYSLAVCCLVLLTGLEPAQLFDDNAAVWHWKHHTSVNESLATILDKMLAHRPSDRYPTAEDVLGALQSVPFTQSPLPQPPLPQSLPNTAPPPQVQQGSEALSQVRTIAVEHPVQDKLPRTQKPVIPPVYRAPRPESNSGRRGAKTIVLVILGLLTALLSAGAGWMLMQFLMLRPWLKEPPKMSPKAVETRSPQQPSPRATVHYSKTLNLMPGQPVTVQGTLQPGELQIYRFEGKLNDELSANLTGNNITFNLLRSDLTSVGRHSQATANWQGILPQTDTYTLQLNNNSPQQPQSFQLTLGLSTPPPVSLPSSLVTPSVVPSASPTPTTTTSSLIVDTSPLDVSPNAPFQQRSTGQLPPAHIQRYTINARVGQVLSVSVADNTAVTLTLRDSTGKPISSAQDVLNWQSLVTEAGTYQIDVVPINPTQPTPFAVDIGLKQP